MGEAVGPYKRGSREGRTCELVGVMRAGMGRVQGAVVIGVEDEMRWSFVGDVQSALLSDAVGVEIARDRVPGSLRVVTRPSSARSIAHANEPEEAMVRMAMDVLRPDQGGRGNACRMG